MQVKSIAECSKGSILQYIRPSFSYQLSLGRKMFCLFLSSCFTQVLLYLIQPKLMKKNFSEKLNSKSLIAKFGFSPI